MATITIPEKITKGEKLVIIPRKEYRELLRVYKKASKGNRLDQRLEKALDDIRAGRVFGPFRNVESLMKSLEK